MLEVDLNFKLDVEGINMRYCLDFVMYVKSGINVFLGKI